IQLRHRRRILLNCHIPYSPDTITARFTLPLSAAMAAFSDQTPSPARGTAWPWLRCAGCPPVDYIARGPRRAWPYLVQVEARGGERKETGGGLKSPALGYLPNRHRVHDATFGPQRVNPAAE